MDANPTRVEIEKSILEKGYRVSTIIDRRDPEANWGPGKEFENYIAAWYKLGNWYMRNEDSQISVEVLQDYLSLFRTAADCLAGAPQDAPYREEIEEILNDLRGCFYDIFKYAQPIDD
ncbi:hypothetical protein [Aggregatilinea lenta]|uniref:hypothetical protein n=1 Tax=Aggregatilinea lenta TaxID=913108 RepID=UPI000E5A233D|nr:hypothetical protein [Aggregatilinea lenta]